MTFPGLKMTILKFHDFSRFSVTVRVWGKVLTVYLVCDCLQEHCKPIDLSAKALLGMQNASGVGLWTK